MAAAPSKNYGIVNRRHGVAWDVRRTIAVTGSSLFAWNQNKPFLLLCYVRKWKYDDPEKKIVFDIRADSNCTTLKT